MKKRQVRQNEFGHKKLKLVNNSPKRKNRLIVLICLLVTIIVPAFFLLKNKISLLIANISQPEKYEFIKPLVEDRPMTDVFNPETKINSTTDLQDVIQQAISGLQGEYGVYFIDLNSKAEIKIKAEEQFQAASVGKIVPMALYYQLVEQGKRSLDDVYILQQADRQRYGTGSIQYQPLGTKYTYAELLDLAGKQSDNTADFILRQNLGNAALTSFMTKYNLDQTNLSNVISTPEDIGQFLMAIYEEQVLNNKYRNMFYDNLTDTLFEDRIPQGVPSQIRIVHKIGNGFNLAYNDCGIVFSPNPFVLCVMSRDASESEALKVIPKIARAAYEWITTNQDKLIKF